MDDKDKDDMDTLGKRGGPSIAPPPKLLRLQSVRGALEYDDKEVVDLSTAGGGGGDEEEGKKEVVDLSTAGGGGDDEEEGKKQVVDLSTLNGDDEEEDREVVE